MPVGNVLLMTDIGGTVRTQVVSFTPPGYTSFRDLVNAGPISTSLSPATWGALFGDAVIEPNCNAEGIEPGSLGAPARVRFGIVGNNEPDCDSSDSFMGFGGFVSSCSAPVLSVGASSGIGCGPDTNVPAFGYVFVRSRRPAGAYVTTFAPEDTTGTPISLGDDQTSGLLPLGFSFRFFDDTYTSVNISSNGFIGFDAGMSQGCCSGRPIPESDGIDNIIAASWTDLFPPGGGSITYETRGSAPNRRFVVSYGNVPWCCSNGPGAVTMQIVLYEGTDLVRIFTTSQESGDTYTQGVENVDGTRAYFLPGRVEASYGLTNDGVELQTY